MSDSRAIDPETIAAIATAPGRGGIGIVRVSGPATLSIATAVLGRVPDARAATFGPFRNAAGEILDAGLALYFPAPHSYTGEHVLELQGHGGPMVLAEVLAAVLAAGARRAQPGEFTQRAYLNDKLDLAQAEAVADLIDAGSREAARAALRSLQGAFSTEIDALVDALIELRMWVEAAIDFPEEEIDFLADQALQSRLAALRARFAQVTQTARVGRVLRDGMTVVIAGRPNAGKSSLLNALAGHEAAIVTAIPGTTRDVLREYLAIDGMPLHVIDTAGLREATDPIEREGIRRARAEMERADRVLFVIDATTDPDACAWQEEKTAWPATLPVTLVLNKIDLLDPQARTAIETTDLPVGVDARLLVSARDHQGLDALRAHLKDCMGYLNIDAGAVSARGRHLEALAVAERHTDTALQQLTGTRAGELVAEELRAAQRALQEITGEFASDDLLGRIFGSFCIGK
jgi:tRNA modification GTPase